MHGHAVHPGCRPDRIRMQIRSERLAYIHHSCSNRFAHSCCGLPPEYSKALSQTSHTICMSPMQALPSHVDAETAAAEGWWELPEYMIKELSVNSTIGAPRHDERVRMDRDRSYTLRGCAYSGGGRRIIRVEVSFDGGAASRLL